MARVAVWTMVGLAFLSSGAVAQDGVLGHWRGELNVGGQSLALIFHVDVDADGEGELSATLDVPAQGATGIPAASTTFSGDTLTITIPTLPGGVEYVGVLGEDGRIEGTFTQGGMALPLVLERTEAGGGLERPQHPEPPFPYLVEEVRYPNAEAGIELAGTFTVPAGEGPYPAVLLITGSGPQDRDETVAGHRVFAVVADHLTRQGIAVLRVDDRGVGESTGDFAAADSRDFVSDARAAVTWLESRPEIDTGAVGLVGHSEGGLIAPMVAADDDRVDFIVLLAGPGVPGSEILPEQGDRIQAANGASESARATSRRIVEAAIEVVLRVPEAERRDSLTHLLRVTYDTMDAAQRMSAGVPSDSATRETMIATQAEQLGSPWMAYFLAFDPREALRRVTVPVLAINGSLDLQVPADQNLPEIERALAEAGNERVTIRELEGLNHLFQHTETGSPTEYATISETFAVEALELVADWILEVTGRR